MQTIEIHDPHSNLALDVTIFPEKRAWFEKRWRENDENYAKLKESGVEYRGWRFWPPFYCMGCGRPISTSQWLFCRLCGTCDVDPRVPCVQHMLKTCFAGQFERTRGTEDLLNRWTIIDVRTEKGKALMQRARSMLTKTRKPQPRFPTRIPRLDGTLAEE